VTQLNHERPLIPLSSQVL